MKKKGFLNPMICIALSFVSDIKSGKKQVTASVYSHLVYDIIPDKKQVIEQPDILILEGLNVLQSNQDYLMIRIMFRIRLCDFSFMLMLKKNYKTLVYQSLFKI